MNKRENLIRLLKHYKEIGRTDAYNDILKKYPDLEIKEEVKEEIKPKRKKK